MKERLPVLNPSLLMPLDWGEEKLLPWNSIWMLPHGMLFWSLSASTAEVWSGSFYLVYPLGSCPSPGVSPHTWMGSSVYSLRPEKVETDVNANLVGRSSSLKGRAALYLPSTRRGCRFSLFWDFFFFLYFGGAGGGWWHGVGTESFPNEHR